MTEQPVVVIADVPLEGAVSKYLSQLLERAEVLSPARFTSQAIEGARAEAVAWVARHQTVSEEDLMGMPKLRMLSAMGVGYNHIDVEAATARRIPVCINPVFSRSIAEAALTLILALSKRLPRLVNDARSGQRPLESERGVEIRGKTLGVVGYGRIGREIGELGHRLEMEVVAHDPYVSPDRVPPWCRLVALEELLRAADFVVVAAPLTPQTHHLIGRPQLLLMRSSAHLVNIARGPLVDEAALLQVLQDGRIAGAGLDVWENEPVPLDHPLLALDNVIGTPHRLGATWESLQHVCESIQDNVLRVLAGQRPKHVVNPEIFD